MAVQFVDVTVGDAHEIRSDGDAMANSQSVESCARAVAAHRKETMRRYLM
jgi:hypothetical protein